MEYFVIVTKDRHGNVEVNVGTLDAIQAYHGWCCDCGPDVLFRGSLEDVLKAMAEAIEKEK